MSTKTTFKRIALVAVASLGFGMLSVAPSNAAGMLADTLVNAADGTATVASTGTLNTAATAKIVWSGVATGAADTATVTGTITSIPAASSSYLVTFAATSSITANVNAVDTVTAGVIVANGSAGRVTKYVTASFTPDKVGTYVIALKATGGVNNQTVTWTITVTAPAAATAASSSVNIYSNFTGTAEYAYGQSPYGEGGFAQVGRNDKTAGTATSIDVATTAALAGQVVGGVLVYESNSPLAIVGEGNTNNTALATPITATISRGGYVAVGLNGNRVYGTSITESSTTTGDGTSGYESRIKYVSIKSDGTTGPATITISTGGVVLGTVAVNFYGKASKVTATQNFNVLTSSLTGATKSAAVQLYVTDSVGQPVAGAEGSIYGTTSDKTVLTSSTAGAGCVADDVSTVSGVGYYLCDVTSAVNGTSGATATMTFTVQSSATTVLATASPLTFSLGNAAIASLTMTPNQASYIPGEKVTVALVAKDSAGNPVADSSITFLAGALTPSAGVTSDILAGGLAKFAKGASSFSFYAPYSNGVVTLNGTYVSTSAVASALRATAVSTSFTVSNPAVEQSQAATDAAAEATDAANAATDAANAAAEAADAATAAAQDAADAVAALSTQVAEMIDALKKQITALTNLVIKIQKKVKA
jgi:hypothetical protein